jgi:Protein of unknown function (DUF551)
MIEDENGWISVDDALPEEDVEVIAIIISDSTVDITKATYISNEPDEDEIGFGSWWSESVYIDDDEYGTLMHSSRQIPEEAVTHWRPIVLPKVYEDKDGNN